MPLEYHEIYYKEDFQNLGADDNESLILVKPLITTQIESINAVVKADD